MAIYNYTEEDKAPYLWARDECNKIIERYIAESKMNALPTEEQCVFMLKKHIEYRKDFRTLGLALIWGMFMPDFVTSIRELLGRRRQTEREWQLNSCIAENCIKNAFSNTDMRICMYAHRYRTKVIAELWDGKIASVRIRYADITAGLSLKDIVERIMQVREVHSVLGKSMVMKSRGWREEKESDEAHDRMAIQTKQAVEFEKAEPLLRESLSQWNADFQRRYKALTYVVSVKFENGSVLKFRVYYKRVSVPSWSESVNRAIALVKTLAELPCSAVDIENTRGKHSLSACVDDDGLV